MCVQCKKHSPVLMKLICDELNVGCDDILDFELCLADAVPAVSLLLLLNIIGLICDTLVYYVLSLLCYVLSLV